MMHISQILAVLFFSGSIAFGGAIPKVPFTITKPGKYFLLKSLTPAATAAGDAAITIAADDVELDLGGFSVLANSAAPQIIRGIFVDPGTVRVNIHHGRVVGFTDFSILADNSSQVELQALFVSAPTHCAFLSSSSRVHNCQFVLTSAAGVALTLANEGSYTVQDCSFAATVAAGAEVQTGVLSGASSLAASTVRDCSFFKLKRGMDGSGGNLQIANNLFRSCATNYIGVTSPAGFNQ